MKSRVEKNQKLYETLYDGELDPSDIEAELKPTSLNSESDSLREKYRSKVSFEEDVNGKEKETTTEEQVEKSASSYDINSLINEAKAKLQNDDEATSNTQYDILKSLNLDKNEEIEQEELSIDAEHELTKEQGIVFDDLMPDNENTLVTDAIIEETTVTEITVEKKDSDFEEDTFVTPEKEEKRAFDEKSSDDTFYTGNFKFKEKELMKKEHKSRKKDGGVLVKILLMILGILITVLVLYIVNNYIK